MTGELPDDENSIWPCFSDCFNYHNMNIYIDLRFATSSSSWYMSEI